MSDLFLFQSESRLTEDDIIQITVPMEIWHKIEDARKLVDGFDAAVLNAQMKHHQISGGGQKVERRQIGENMVILYHRPPPLYGD